MHQHATDATSQCKQRAQCRDQRALICAYPTAEYGETDGEDGEGGKCKEEESYSNEGEGTGSIVEAAVAPVGLVMRLVLMVMMMLGGVGNNVKRLLLGYRGFERLAFAV